jgi:mannose-6-phosphate isomerase-like protein (cupin superfamily)
MASKVPSWQGRFPFPPESKVPCKINYSNQISTIYGNPPHQNIVNKYVSSDRLTVGDFIVFSGGYFEPPGYHGGDEIYYIRSGQATVTNPETGETYLAREGDGFVVSQNTWHQVFNYEKEDLVIFTAHAPTLYSKDGMGAEISFLKKYAYLSLDASAPRSGDFRQSMTPEFIYRLYEFPVNGKIAREQKQIIHVPREKFFHFVCGEHNFIRRSFIVSNDYVHTSLVKMFSGSISDQETHQGDEVVNVIQGEMNVEIAKEEKDKSVSAESFNIREQEKMFIPEGYTHRFLNLHGRPVLFYSCIAPKL